MCRGALPCGHNTDYNFCLITFKLHMLVVHDERRNTIDLGHGVKGQILHFVYKTLWARYRLQFLPNHFQTSHDRMNPIDFGSRGQRSRSNLALYLKNLVGVIQATVFAQSLSNFTCKLLMMNGGTLLILGHGVKGQGQIDYLAV